MKRLYILLLCLLASTAMFATEVFTVDMHIETGIAIDNNSISSSNTTDLFVQNDQIKKKIHTSYSDGKLTITGVNSKSNISIYNLLGRKVVDLKNISINGTFSKYLDLP